MKKLLLACLFMIFIVLGGCEKKEPEIIIEDNGYRFSDRLGQMIPVISIEAPNSKVTGNMDNFINTSKPIEVNPLFFQDSSLKTHRLILGFDGVYPLAEMQLTPYIGKKAQTINKISIDISMNGNNYERLYTDVEVKQTQKIDFGSRMVKFIKIVFPADQNRYGLQDLRFTLADGVIVRENKEWTSVFHRYEYWTGADGIYSFNLTDGNDAPGAPTNTTGFIFSDTYVGDVAMYNNLRQSMEIINNSLGYYDHSKSVAEGISFDYPEANGKARSVFLPDAYIGSRGRNLLDGNGLSLSQNKNAKLTNNPEGTMWLTEVSDQMNLTVDLFKSYDLDAIYLWNYNANPDYGVKSFDVAYSEDGQNWTYDASYNLNKALGSHSEAYHLEIPLRNLTARYLRFNITSTYSSEKAGLGKMMIFGDEGRFLFGKVTANSEITEKIGEEVDARLWLQDGIVLNNYLNLFPILIKDEADFFNVFNVSMIKVPIVEESLDYDASIYLSTPLEVNTNDGGKLFFGTGLMNNVLNDGYVYIYGYKDLNGRHLIVARSRPEDFENFNSWTYFNGETFASDINACAPLIEGVSAELSVSYIGEGRFAGKYMLVVMEDTSSGKISYSLSDTPYGNFSDFQPLYETWETNYFNKDVYTYNAKMHPHLSTPDNLFITYNVNSYTVRGGQDGRICYPRVINVISVKK